MYIGFKNLLQEKTRLAVSVGGLAMALILILILDGMFAGAQRQITAYLSDSPDADVWVMQSGVSNMHMATSSLPSDKRAEIAKVAGVRGVSPILYMSTAIKMAGKRQFTYIVGYDPDGQTGGPWRMWRGTAKLKDGEVVVDRIAAEQRGLGIGDDVRILGREFRIAGLSSDTFSMANTYTFMRRDDLARLIDASGRVSYFIVDTKGPPAAVARRIEDRVGGVNALTRNRFVGSERTLVAQMGIDLINLMATVGFIVGVMVVGLTIYTLTLERTRDFGIVKAVGAGRWRLYRIVFEQSFLSVGLGLAVGLVLAFGARLVIEAAAPEISIVYRPELLARTALALAAVGFIASYVPVRRVARLDPMIVFKG